MAFVRGVTAASTSSSSRFSVSGRTSTKTGLAPSRTNALAVEEKVNEGRITSSPGPSPHKRAAISSADVQEFTIDSEAIQNRSRNRRSQLLVKWPSLAIPAEEITRSTFFAAASARNGRLNGISDRILLILIDVFTHADITRADLAATTKCGRATRGTRHRG